MPSIATGITKTSGKTSCDFASLCSLNMPFSLTGDPVGETPWTSLKTILQRLYLEEDLSLTEVMKKMAEDYGFNAT